MVRCTLPLTVLVGISPQQGQVGRQVCKHCALGAQAGCRQPHQAAPRAEVQHAPAPGG